MKKSFLLLILVAAVGGLIALGTNSVASNNEKQKSRILKQIEDSPSFSVSADNSRESRLDILESGSKEISADDYKILTSEPGKYIKQSSYPDVTLKNNSLKSIKSFAIVVKSNVEDAKRGHVLLKNNLAIPPGATFKVGSGEWLQAERITVRKDGQFVDGLRQPGLESPKFWLPGGITDLKVLVTYVEFDDGSKWMIPPA